jgi:uncharacterized protein YbjT (DUF2867 family)
MTQNDPIAPSRVLVLGGTGKTGRRVAARLPGARAASRRGRPPFDWTDRATWEPTLAGTDAVYLSYFPDISAPGAADAVGAFASLAAARGVRRLVLLSARGLPAAQEAERAVAAAGAAWTVLRASWFAQNFGEEFPADEIRAGEFALPAAPGLTEPFVDAEDIADVAVAALTEAGERHAGRVYELSGPRAWTLAEAADAIAAATGRPVRFTALSPDAYRRRLTERLGLPDADAALLTGIFAAVLDGRNARPAPGVTEALGRPAAGFAAYVRRAAATGAWDPAE